MDIDAQDEELANLHIDLVPRKGDFTRKRDLGGHVFACFYSRRDEFLKKGRLSHVSHIG